MLGLCRKLRRLGGIAQAVHHSKCAPSLYLLYVQRITILKLSGNTCCECRVTFITNNYYVPKRYQLNVLYSRHGVRSL